MYSLFMEQEQKQEQKIIDETPEQMADRLKRPVGLLFA